MKKKTDLKIPTKRRKILLDKWIKPEYRQWIQLIFRPYF